MLHNGSFSRYANKFIAMNATSQQVPYPAYAVIVAGGKGARMGNALPKQFIPIHGKPVLYYTLHAFCEAIPDIHIILVLPSEQISYAQMVLREFATPPEITLVSGGETRFHSVQNGLSCVPAHAIVLVHDGVRPLVSTQLIQNCYELAITKGAVIPVIPVADSIRSVVNEESHPVDRSQLHIVQTPQAFQASILHEAMKQPWNPSFTDEATVAEAAGHKIWLTLGEKTNIKITTPEDMHIASALLNRESR